jgi:hypothetical protein
MSIKSMKADFTSENLARLYKDSSQGLESPYLQFLLSGVPRESEPYATLAGRGRRGH